MTWAKMSGRVSAVGMTLAAAIGGALLAAAPAQSLTCSAPPGAPTESVEILGTEACGANTEGPGGAWSHGGGGVGFADSRGDSRVGAVGLDGGVGAAESAGGLLAAVGVGAESLALGVLDQPGTALVATGPRSQAFIGDATDPVLCVGEMALAANLTTGQGCVVYGSFRYATAP
ncbi:DUF6764 family protein [Rhodococcus artemisiae]|nr:DUF6764 family protein [Rhodococcus artemisiae]